MFAVAVAFGLVTSFTAANTVPLSRAGVTKSTLAPNQLAPSYCSSLALTKLVVATTIDGHRHEPGTTSCSGATPSGSQALNGGSGDDCIVAGGSTSSTSNAIDGGAGTDICIGAPGDDDDVHELRVHRHAIDRATR